MSPETASYLAGKAYDMACNLSKVEKLQLQIQSYVPIVHKAIEELDEVNGLQALMAIVSLNTLAQQANDAYAKCIIDIRIADPTSNLTIPQPLPDAAKSLASCTDLFKKIIKAREQLAVAGITDREIQNAFIMEIAK